MRIGQEIQKLASVFNNVPWKGTNYTKLPQFISSHMVPSLYRSISRWQVYIRTELPTNNTYSNQSSQYIPYKLLSIDRTDYHTIKTFDFPGLLPLPQTRQISLIIILPTSVMSMSQQGCSKELLARVSNNINTTGQFNGPWGKSVL